MKTVTIRLDDEYYKDLAKVASLDGKPIMLAATECIEFVMDMYMELEMGFDVNVQKLDKDGNIVHELLLEGSTDVRN